MLIGDVAAINPSLAFDDSWHREQAAANKADPASNSGDRKMGRAAFRGTTQDAPAHRSSGRRETPGHQKCHNGCGRPIYVVYHATQVVKLDPDKRKVEGPNRTFIKP
jgi:hypothetical protein